MNMEEDGNQFRITCSYSNVFVTCSGISGELLNIEIFDDVRSTLGLYPEELVPEHFYFHWPAITKL